MSHLMRNLKLIVIFVLTFTTVLSANLIGFTTVNAQTTEESLKSTYAQRKQDIDKRKDEIQKGLNEATGEFNSYGSRKKTLKEEVDAREKEIEQLEVKIKEIEIVVDEISKQRVSLESQKKDLINQLGALLIEMQRENRLPLVARALQGNIKESLEKMLSYNSLRNQIESLSEKIDKTDDELEANLKNQEELKTQFTDAKAIINNKKENTDALLKQTEGKETEYQKLIKDLEQQAKQEEEARSKLDPELQRKIKELQDNQAKIAASKINTNSQPIYSNPPVGSTCPIFEVQGLNVPADFFGPVTSGVYLQGFGCRNANGSNHDGIDIGNNGQCGGAVISSARGILISREYSGDGRGNNVVIEVTAPSGQKVYTEYWHLQSFVQLPIGSTVEKGQLIGKMGTSGFSYGCHVHFVMLADTMSNGLICGNYGFISTRAKCYNPLKYIKNIGGA